MNRTTKILGIAVIMLLVGNVALIEGIWDFRTALIVSTDKVAQRDITITWQKGVIEAQAQHFKGCSFINSKSIRKGHDNYLQYIETHE